MKHLLPKILPAMALLTALSVNARSLTPDEALSKAFNQPQRIGAKSNANFTLIRTIKAPSTAENALYVFSRPNGEGCAIIAADDAVDNILLGYTESGKYDEDNLPPAFRWWLDACAYTVEEKAAESSAQLLRDRLPRLNKKSTSPQKAAKAPASYASIDPLVSTQWNQSAPYNNLTPLMEGQRAVTGCVATAMAQIMKRHNWPEHGTGSNSYSLNYNGKNYDISAVFEGVNYDWDNMLDSYNYGATAEQEEAVAKLMMHCGVAVNMGYTPVESGATVYDAGRALIQNFGYDKGLTYNRRAWYTDDEWNDLMYGELSQGHPILYSGQDISTAGHAFVCDGYSSDGYFHINWGWGGWYDGYFLLSVLDPESQGIGGGSAQSGYNYGQIVLTNIQPSRGSEDFANVIALSDKFRVDVDLNFREEGDFVAFQCTYFSYSFETFYAKVGIRIINEDTDIYIPSLYRELEFPPFNGYNVGIAVDAMEIPVGTYEVYPAFKDGDEWKQMKWDVELNPTPLKMVVTDTQITFNNNPSQEEEEKTTISSRLSNISYDGVAVDENLYIGNTYDLTYDIEVEGHFAYDTFTALIKDNYVYCIPDDFVWLDVKDDNVQRTYQIEIDSSVEPGTYEVGLIGLLDDGLYLISDRYPVEVKEKEEDKPIETDPNGGDVNGDNSLNVTDVVITIDYILGNKPANFDIDAADINKDGQVNVTDVVMIIDKILNSK